MRGNPLGPTLVPKRNDFFRKKEKHSSRTRKTTKIGIFREESYRIEKKDRGQKKKKKMGEATKPNGGLGKKKTVLLRKMSGVRKKIRMKQGASRKLLKF